MDLNPTTLLRDTMRSLGFLTRFPIGESWFFNDDGILSSTCRAFPIAGALAAFPAIAILWFSELIQLPSLLTGLAVVSTMIITTGALHEDGLADISDGFFGGKGKEQSLEIMKDSRIGAYGALVLIMAFSLRAIAIAAIVQVSVISATLAVGAAAAVSRGALVWHWSELESARPGGTSDKVGSPTEDATIFAIMSSTIIAVVAGLIARGLVPMLLACAFAALTTIAFKRLSLKKIGGQTGDTLGAAAVLAECAFFMGLASGI